MAERRPDIETLERLNRDLIHADSMPRNSAADDLIARGTRLKAMDALEAHVGLALSQCETFADLVSVGRFAYSTHFNTFRDRVRSWPQPDFVISIDPRSGLPLHPCGVEVTMNSSLLDVRKLAVLLDDLVVYGGCVVFFRDDQYLREGRIEVQVSNGHFIDAKGRRLDSLDVARQIASSWGVTGTTSVDSATANRLRVVRDDLLAIGAQNWDEQTVAMVRELTKSIDATRSNS